MLTNDKISKVFPFNADIREWLPGDSIFDSYIEIPEDIPAGYYKIQVCINGENDEVPKIKLAIEGLPPDGCYHIGNTEVAGEQIFWYG